MILRKPFAILIKYFRTIHIVLTICAFYLVFRTNLILNFYNTYLSSYTSVIGKDLTGELFNFRMFLSLLILIVGSIVIMGLFTYKKKPVKLYLFSIINYLIVSIVYIFVYNITNKLEIGLVDVRTLKLVQDLSTTIFLLQIPFMLSITGRAIGFDVKKFDFKKDLDELEIEDIDREEFEVNFDLDSDSFKRTINKYIRHSKYFYKENKILLISLFIVLVGIISTVLYLNKGVYNKTYSINNTLKTSYFTFSVKEVYGTSKNIKGSTILTDEALVGVILSIKNNSTKERVFEPSRLTLNVKDHSFSYTANYNDSTKDIATPYNNQIITNNSFSTYMIVFKIPKTYLKEKMILKYADYYGDDVNIKFTVKNLDGDVKTHEYYLNEKIDFSESILKDTNFIVNSFEVGRPIRIEYDYNVNGINYPSHEYLYPSYSGKENKYLFRINGQIIKNDNETDLTDFIKTYATIEYVVFDETKRISTFDFVKSTKIVENNNVYIEVPEELEYAFEIRLVFNIRNNKYIYYLKQ